MDENLEWLTQNTEDPKRNKGNLIYINLPPFQVYPPFLAKNFVPPFKKGGGGEGGGFQQCIYHVNKQ